MTDYPTEKPMSSKIEGRRHGGEDRISLLPDPLLCQILSNLPTKDAVKTSLLSERWRYVWLSVPGLDLDDGDFQNYESFSSFVDRFLGFSVESPTEKLKLVISKRLSDDDDDNPLDIKPWVEAAAKRKIQHLEIDCSKSCMGFGLLLVHIYTACQTLVCLRLRFVAVDDLKCVSFPCLKTMHLEEVSFLKNDAGIETLIACCPVLEDLSVVRSDDDLKVLRVCSQTITRLSLVLDVAGYKIWYMEDYEVVIDAPRVKYLSLKANQSTNFTIKSLSSSAVIDIDVGFNVGDTLRPDDLAKRSSIGNFLSRISNVRDMTICWKTLKVIRQYRKLEPLPQFCNMSRLHVKIFAADLEMLPDLLECCPNLKSLVLELNGSIKKEEQISFSASVPWCLKSCLECVEMRKPISGFGVEMKLIRYFLENSTVLKKLTLSLGCPRMQQESIVFMELLRFRRCSSACQVEVVGLEETLMKL